MKVKILKRDFDAAVKVPWSPTTCVLQQTANRTGILHNSIIAQASETAYQFRDAFDEAYNQRHGTPIDPNRMAQLRAQLPITVEVPDSWVTQVPDSWITETI